jgi:hypothetical protein
VAPSGEQKGVRGRVMRGYLWENLEREIAEEFDFLSNTAPICADRVAERRQWREGVLSLREEREFAREAEVFAREYRSMRLRMAEQRRHTVPAARAQVSSPVVESSTCTKPYCRRSRIAGRSWCQHHVDIANRTKERGMKERLEVDRSGITHHFTITAKCDQHDAGDVLQARCERCGGSGVYEVKGYITTNTYPDGRLGEIFVGIGKTSSSEAWVDQWARAASFALQYGAPVDEFFGKFIAQNFEPSGATKNKRIPRCSSVLDYVARHILGKFGGDDMKRRVALMAAHSTEEEVHA